MWLGDEPRFDIDSIFKEQLDLLTTYPNNLCTAVHPLLQSEQTPQHSSQTRFANISETDYITDLSNLINRFQRHTKCWVIVYCSNFLKKMNGKVECRFHFPHGSTRIYASIVLLLIKMVIVNLFQNPMIG